MKIAIASGKGGTGKTTFATNLALTLSENNQVQFMDCDVEAPNAHLFLHPDINEEIPATIWIPEINADRCTLCGKCVEVCQFHALAKVGKTIMVFAQLCHGCGSCTWNCPEDAITEVPDPIGVIERGRTPGGIPFSHGKLTLSEPMATPIIRQLKKSELHNSADINIYDSPPGASCSVVETVRGMDYVVLVTEPTPFGLHDLKQMLGILDEMEIPFGVVINRDGIGDGGVDQYLLENQIPILMRIPFNREIARGIAAGKMLNQIDPKFNDKFRTVFDQIKNLVNDPGGVV